MRNSSAAETVEKSQNRVSSPDVRRPRFRFQASRKAAHACERSYYNMTFPRTYIIIYYDVSTWIVMVEVELKLT